MPRYEDRGGVQTRLYVGRLSSRTRSRDLEDLFSKYGRVRDVDLKHDFAFVEYSDPRDADEAIRYLNGKDFEGSRLVVEFARRVRDFAISSSLGPRGPGGAREYLGRGPPPGTGRCYNCGNDGHWARDCKAGDWRDKCYRCGQRGHIERNCRNSPRPFNRYERSRPSRSRSPVDRTRSRSARRGRSQSRSYSRSRSYSPKKTSRSPIKGETRNRRITRSRSRSLSPGPPPRKGSQSRSRSPVGNGRNLSRSPQASRRDPSHSRSPRDHSPSRKDHSPRPELENHSPLLKDSPLQKDEHSRSPSVE